MDAGLRDFLARRTPVASEFARWGPLDLEIDYYIADELPPVHLVTSVRAVITTSDEVLVLREPTGAEHIIPGGRRRQSETLEDTVRREILEETCWTVTDLSLLAVVHFHIHGAVPDDYPYPSPDFLQLIYATSPDEFHPERSIEDDWVERCELCSLSSLYERRAIPPPQRILLDHALNRSRD